MPTERRFVLLESMEDLDEPQDEQIPGEDQLIRAGDPDTDPLANEYVGSETPGGSNSSPDQNNVDDIGRAYGLEEDEGADLELGDDRIDPRDRDRWELDPDSRDGAPPAPRRPRRMIR